MNPIQVPDLGGYLRQQRQAARLSLRQLSDVAGISNPYLSQIERGLKKPSAEILQQLAKGLRISAESLYVRAGILEERAEAEAGHQPDVAAAILADRRLSDRQQRVLLDVYASLVGDELQIGESAVDESTVGEGTQEATPKPGRRATPRTRPAGNPDQDSTPTR